MSSVGGGNDRFYVMALTDFNPGTTYYWYYSLTGMPDVTSGSFGKGRANTTTMIKKWNNSSYGTQNGGDSYDDMWGAIQTQANKGWFVPSLGEWYAFGDFCYTKLNPKMTNKNYNSTYELSSSYLTSVQCGQQAAWYVSIYYTAGNHNRFQSGQVRLGTTF